MEAGGKGGAFSSASLTPYSHHQGVPWAACLPSWVGPDCPILLPTSGVLPSLSTSPQPRSPPGRHRGSVSALTAVAGPRHSGRTWHKVGGSLPGLSQLLCINHKRIVYIYIIIK